MKMKLIRAAKKNAFSALFAIALVLANVCAADRMPKVFDYRARCSDGGVLLSANKTLDVSELNRTELASSEAPATGGTLAVGDTLTFVLFDDVSISLTLKEKTPTPLGGEAFLAESKGYVGVKNAVVIRTEDGFQVDVRDSKTGIVYIVSSSYSGVVVRAVKPTDAPRTCGTQDDGEIVTNGAPVLSKMSRNVSANAMESGAPAYVDILVAYDTRAANWATVNGGGVKNFAETQVQKMNTAIANTGLDASFRFRLVGVYEVGGDAGGVLNSALEVAKSGGTLNGHSWKGVLAKRDEVEADIVCVLIDNGTDTGTTGKGYSLTQDSVDFTDNAYNACLIRAVANTHTMTHEVGHNMGAGHSDAMADKSNCGPQYYSYSSGYYFTVGSERYFTIMAYNTDGYGNYYTEVPYFSSPDYSYDGVAVGDATHDNSLTLKNLFLQTSRYRGWVVSAEDVGAAIGCSDRSWETDGNYPWQVISDAATVGLTAARSCEMPYDTTSWLRTQVTGPVTLSFDYMLRTLDGSFTVTCDDDELFTRKNADIPRMDWESQAVSIPSGTHTVTFSYTHAFRYYVGDWGSGVRLDNVIFGSETPDEPEPTVVKIENPSGVENLVYTAAEQFGVTAYDPRLLVRGSIRATDAGTYAVIFSLPADTTDTVYRWSDGSTGALSVNWSIAARPVTDYGVTFVTIPDQTYTGTAIMPMVTMTYAGAVRMLGTDYTVSYADNVNVGTARAIVTGKGNFIGMKALAFDVVPSEVVKHTVTFDLGDHGTRTGGGELEQNVIEGEGAIEPTFSVDDGWEFTGWSSDFSSVTSNMTVTANYHDKSKLYDGYGYTEKVGDYTWTFSIINGEAEIGVRDEKGGVKFYECAVKPKPQGEITIPDSLGGCHVTVLGAFAFYDCDELESASVPESVRRIEQHAFAYCYSLSSVALSRNLEYIGSCAFWHCSRLSLNIPDKVSQIVESAFYRLKGLTVDVGNPWFASEDGALFDKSKAELYFWPRDKKIVLPATLRNIRSNACSDNNAMRNERLLLPSAVTNIGTCAFSSCSFESVTLNEGLLSIGYLAFSRATGLRYLVIPSTVQEIGPEAFSECSKLGSLFFIGNAPQVYSSLYSGALSNLVTYVRSGSTGWKFTDSTMLPELWPEVDGEASDSARDIRIWETYPYVMHTVTFDLGDHASSVDGGALVQSIIDGEGAIEPILNVEEGWRLTGWSCDFSKVTENLTVKALWEEIIYHTVIFDLCARGTRTGGGELEQKVIKGEGAVEPTFSVDDGWEFTGWSSDFSNVTSNMTVTANYHDKSKLYDGYGYTETVGDYTWTFSIINGEAEIGVRDENGYAGVGSVISPEPAGMLVVPDRLGGCPVTALADYALNCCNGLRSVIIPATVNVIGRYVFAGSDNLFAVFYKGNAPTGVDEWLYDGTSDGLVSYAREGSTGWTTDGGNILPEKWPAADENGNGVPRAVRVWTTYPEIVWNVKFDLRDWGERTGGGALTQQIKDGEAAVAPEVKGHDGWAFSGWYGDFDCITGETTVYAKYERLEIAFEDSEVYASAGEPFVLTVNGGCDDAAVSVKIDVAYGNAKATDLDLTRATVAGSNGVERTGLQFPLTVKWKAGDRVPKTITIPTLSGKTTDAPKCLVWSLSQAKGLDLGLPVTCTGTIAAGDDWKADEVYVMAYTTDAAGGKASGSASVKQDAQGNFKSVTLKATPSKGYWFAGWYNADGCWISSDLTFKITPWNADCGVLFTYEARFVPTQTSLCGTYNGFARVDLTGMTLVAGKSASDDEGESIVGEYPFTVTLAKDGKLSGAITVGGKKIALKSDACCEAPSDTGDSEGGTQWSYVVHRLELEEKLWFGKSNIESIAIQIDRGVGETEYEEYGVATLWSEGTASDDGFTPLAFDSSYAYRAIDKTDQSLVAPFAGTYAACVNSPDGSVIPLSVNVDKSGKVKATGWYLDGTTLTLTGTLAYRCLYAEENEYIEDLRDKARVDLFASPKTLGSGSLHLGLELYRERLTGTVTGRLSAQAVSYVEEHMIWTDGTRSSVVSEPKITKLISSDEMQDSLFPYVTGCWIPADADPDFGIVRLTLGTETNDIAYVSKNGVITGLGKTLQTGVTVKFDVKTGLLSVTKGREYAIYGVLGDYENECAAAGCVYFNTCSDTGNLSMPVEITFLTLEQPEEKLPWTEEKFSLTVGQNFGVACQPSVTSSGAVLALSVSGLPSGLKYDTKTGMITGAPTKAGTSSVKVTYTFGAKKITRTTTMTVAAKPADLPVGTYTGYASIWVDADSDQPLDVPFTATLGKNGTLTGSVTLFGKKATLKASGYESFDSEWVRYLAILDLKSVDKGWGTVTLPLSFGTDDAWADEEVFLPVGHVVAGVEACRSMSKDVGFATRIAPYVGNYVVAFDTASDAGSGMTALSVAVDKKGTAKVAGTFVDGTAFSASATLVPSECGEEGSAWLLAPVMPKTLGSCGLCLDLSFQRNTDGITGEESLSVTGRMSAAKYVMASDDYAAYECALSFAYAYKSRSWVDETIDPSGTCLSVTSEANVFDEAQFAWATKMSAIGSVQDVQIIGVGKTANQSKVTFKLDDKTGLFSGTFAMYRIFGAMIEGACAGDGTLVGKDGSFSMVRVVVKERADGDNK